MLEKNLCTKLIVKTIIILTNLNKIFQMLAACGPQAWSPLVISLAMDLSSQALHTGVGKNALSIFHRSFSYLICLYFAYMLCIRNIDSVSWERFWACSLLHFKVSTRFDRQDSLLIFWPFQTHSRLSNPVRHCKSLNLRSWPGGNIRKHSFKCKEFTKFFYFCNAVMLWTRATVSSG